MRHTTLTILFALMPLTLFSGSCRPGLDFASFAEDCSQHCKSHIICPFLADSHDDEAAVEAKIVRCTETCIADGDESEEQGRACEEAIGEIIACIARLDCNEYREWTLMAMEEFPCSVEHESFNDNCVGIWGNVGG